MAWRRTGDQALPEPVLTKFQFDSHTASNAYISTFDQN